jgi:hypothetical protein
MEVSPFWHAFGTVSAVAFVAMIALSFAARYFSVSDNPALVRFGAGVLSLLGGASVARQVDSELKRRATK